jgi:parallel beta-helix repeat protein
VKFNSLVLDASNLARSCPAGYGCSFGISGAKGAHHVRFTNIEVKNAAGSGVLIMPGPSSIATVFEFIGCDVHHNGVESRDHGFYLVTSENLIRNCQVHHNAGFGIHVFTSNLYRANNNTIDGNDVYSNATTSGSAPGISIDHGSGNRVINNIVRGNKNGIVIGNPYNPGVVTVSDTMIYNNTIYNNVPGVGISIFASSSQTEIRNNKLSRNGGRILDAGSDTVSVNNRYEDLGTGGLPAPPVPRNLRIY